MISPRRPAHGRTPLPRTPAGPSTAAGLDLARPRARAPPRASTAHSPWPVHSRGPRPRTLAGPSTAAGLDRAPPPARAPPRASTAHSPWPVHSRGPRPRTPAGPSTAAGLDRAPPPARARALRVPGWYPAGPSTGPAPLTSYAVTDPRQDP